MFPHLSFHYLIPSFLQNPYIEPVVTGLPLAVATGHFLLLVVLPASVAAGHFLLLVVLPVAVAIGLFLLVVLPAAVDMAAAVTAFFQIFY